LKKENIPSQTIGVMSTPNAGGIDPLIIFSNGSVGHTAILKGASLRLLPGYQDITMRQSMRTEKMLRNGPKTLALRGA